MSKQIKLFEIPVNKKRINVTNYPYLSFIILTKNNCKVLDKGISSIINNTSSKNYEICIADTGSNEKNLKRNKEIAQTNNCKLIEYDYYNFSKINNDMILNHIDPSSKWICLCNDDIEFLNDVVNKVFGYYETLENKDVGSIGIRHHYPNGLSLHGGLICVFGNNDVNVGHVGYRQPRAFTDNRTNCFGNTAATIFIPKEVYLKNKLNEEYLDSYQDVEFCLQNILNGNQNIYCGEAVAIHHESMTRKKEGINKQNFVIDQMKLKKFIVDGDTKLFDLIPNKHKTKIGNNIEGVISI